MSNYVNQRERIDDAFVSAVFNIDVGRSRAFIEDRRL